MLEMWAGSPDGISGGSGGAGAAPWDSGTLYTTGQVVFDRGGTWQAVDSSTNSEPISGNTHWTLIGGMPYVDVTLDPVGLTTAPFFDPLGSGPGVVAIPGPWEPGAFLQEVLAYSTQSSGDTWASNASTQLSYISPAVSVPPLPAQSNSVGDNLGEASPEFPGSRGNLGGGGSPSVDITNQSIVIWSTTDLTNGGATIGSRSLSLRFYYLIGRTGDTVFAHQFYVVTDVNQSAKTFTVSGDASSLGATFSIVGSTGNNGTYTKVSATHDPSVSYSITGGSQVGKTFTIAGNHVSDFPVGTPATVAGSTGNNGVYTVVTAVFTTVTTITVAEVIPNGTFDGTIGHPDETAVVVSQVIPSATADGWVKR